MVAGAAKCVAILMMVRAGPTTSACWRSTLLNRVGREGVWRMSSVAAVAE